MVAQTTMMAVDLMEMEWNQEKLKIRISRSWWLIANREQKTGRSQVDFLFRYWVNGNAIYKDGGNTGNMTNHDPQLNAQRRNISHALTSCKALGLELEYRIYIYIYRICIVKYICSRPITIPPNMSAFLFPKPAICYLTLCEGKSLT